jgi:NADPH:quinone reductase
MRAAWYEKQGAAQDVLIVGKMQDPQPQTGDVRIRIAASHPQEYVADTASKNL